MVTLSPALARSVQEGRYRYPTCGRGHSCDKPLHGATSDFRPDGGLMWCLEVCSSLRIKTEIGRHTMVEGVSNCGSFSS